MKRIKLLKPLVIAFYKAGAGANETSDNDEITFFELYADLLCHALGTTYQAVFSAAGGFRLPDGNWTGMVGQVHRSEADIAVNRIYITEERKEVVDYSYPNYFGGQSFVTRKPQYYPNALSIFIPFSFYVWLVLIACMLLMILAFYFTFSRKESLSKVALEVLATTVSQSLTINPRPGNKSQHILIMFWLLGVAVIGMCYKSLLLSVLTLPALTGVRNVKELAEAVEKGEYNCMTFEGSALPVLLENSNSKYERIIGINIQRNRYGKGYLEDFLSYGNINVAFISNDADLEFLSERYFVSKDSFYEAVYGLVINKDFCCKEQLDVALNRVSEAGLFHKIDDNRTFKLALTHIPSDMEEKKRLKLSLIEVKSAFVIWIIGHIIAGIALVVEVIVNKLQS